MIDFTDAPKLKKGYGGANGNKISILLNGSRWMLKFPSISERSPELHYTKGCISEYIGSHIFQSTGISAQDTLLGTYFINGSENIVLYFAECSLLQVARQELLQKERSPPWVPESTVRIQRLQVRR